MKNRLIVAITALFLSAAATAAEMPEFDTVDADHDGKITAQEAEVVDDLDFEKLDTDDDGTLSQEEYDHADD